VSEKAWGSKTVPSCSEGKQKSFLQQMLSSDVDEEVVGEHTHSMLLRQIAGLCFVVVIGTSCLGRPSDKTSPKFMSIFVACI
jgi:hypothetical protein